MLKTADPNTLGAQIDKLKQRFGLKHVVLVGDRGCRIWVLRGVITLGREGAVHHQQIAVGVLVACTDECRKSVAPQLRRFAVAIAHATAGRQ